MSSDFIFGGMCGFVLALIIVFIDINRPGPVMSEWCIEILEQSDE